VVEAAESKGAEDLVALSIGRRSSLADYLVICSGETDPQLRAIGDEINQRLREQKIKGQKWEGVIGSGWLVLDLGPVVVHVMRQAERDYYRLEELWGKDAVVYHY